MASYQANGVELRILGHPEVYPPGDDSFLMLGALKGARGRALDIGTGSGIIAVYLAKRGCEVVATDINPHALSLASANARQNGVELETVRADVFEGICGTFDVIVFNPPYLPTAPSDVTGDRWLDASVNGGPDGLLFIRRFLLGLAGHLEKDGSAYLLTSSLSGPEPAPPEGLRARVVASARLEFELLRVFEIRRG